MCNLQVQQCLYKLQIRVHNDFRKLHSLWRNHLQSLSTCLVQDCYRVSKLPWQLQHLQVSNWLCLMRSRLHSKSHNLPVREKGASNVLPNKRILQQQQVLSLQELLPNMHFLWLMHSLQARQGFVWQNKLLRCLPWRLLLNCWDLLKLPHRLSNLH